MIYPERVHTHPAKGQLEKYGPIGYEVSVPNKWFVRRNSCPVCEGVTWRRRYDVPYVSPTRREYLMAFYDQRGSVELEYLKGVDYILCECETCDTLFQQDIPGDFLMSRIYESWIDPQTALARQKSRLEISHFANIAQEILRIQHHFSKRPAELKVLDFGMGWGPWALMAKGFGCQVFGMEISADRVIHAEKNGVTIVDFNDSSGIQFDFINTEQVFEHLPDPIPTLKRLKAFMGPQTLIKISVPTANDIEKRLKKMDWTIPKGRAGSLNPVAPLEHINFFRRNSFEHLASKAGLSLHSGSVLEDYQVMIGFGRFEDRLKNYLRPVYRHLLKRQNYVLLKADSA